MKDASWLIEQLGLLPHPEGGYFKETYRCAEQIKARGSNADRNVCTAIYFLLDGDNKSHFHRIKSDELWFFHEGNVVEIMVLNEEGLSRILLGKNIQAGETLQAMIPAGAWFAAKIKGGIGYGLVSCTVAPGFDFEDFELGEKKNLIQAFPKYKALIEEMTLGE